MKKIGLVILAVIAIIFAGCKQELKKDDIEKGVTEMFKSLKSDGIDKALTTFADGYDKMSDSQKQKFQDAFAGKEFKIMKIEGNQVTAEIRVSAANGGQIIVKTVIFKVIQVDGKVRVKDIVNVIEDAVEPTDVAAAENEEVTEAYLDEADNLTEEHD
ncbi:MAG: hypothetical protein MJZ49_06745 [Bacteroidales bacterium]|nr:hypothetical protein [Bacteroidales bacterium]